MQTLKISNHRGATFISTLIAAAVIVVAIGGLGASALKLGSVIKKAEVANLAVAIEANLSAAFLDKANYPDPAANPNSPNLGLRAGTLTSLPLSVSFLGGAPVTIPVPVSDGSSGAEGYFDLELNPCSGFSAKCLLHYQIRLKKFTAPTTSYAFSYQIDANPEVLRMAPLGDVTEFSTPVDPGLYRAETNLTHCDQSEDFFVTGVNRDTGAVLCARKPRLNSCPPRTIAKGLKRVWYPSGPVMELDCTEPMRTYTCKTNYALQTFNARYLDPENRSFNHAPGKCVFLTNHSGVVPGSYPEKPTAPYVKSVSGTFCPPYYKADPSTGCNLVPDTNKNASIGVGKCAPTKYRNCRKPTYTMSPDGGAAHAAWAACKALATPPAAGCGAEPANPLMVTTCSSTLVSNNCDGVVNSGTACATEGQWDSGTAYADSANAYTVQPTAAAKAVVAGRKMTCTYQDTSPPCTAPSTAADGSSWGKRDAKWYGGVQVQGLNCTYDQSVVPEVVDAT